MSRAPLLANAESGAIDPWDPASALNNRAQADDPLDEARGNLERLQANLKSMKKLAESYGTRNDTKQLRDRLQEGRRVTTAIIRDTTNILRTPVSREQRPAQDKLNRTLQDFTRQFKDMSQEHLQRERELVAAMEQRYSAKYGGPPDLDNMSLAHSSGGFGSMRGGRQQQAYETQDGLDDADLAIIQERNRDIQDLNQNMEELGEAFAEVNQMVGYQGQQIDQAAGNVEVAESNVDASAHSLKKGAQYMSAYRKKVVIIVIIIVVVVIIIVGAVVGWACTTGPLSGKCK